MPFPRFHCGRCVTPKGVMVNEGRGILVLTDENQKLFHRKLYVPKIRKAI